MKAILRSLATILLAATVPVLVFGAPRGGVTCTVAIVYFIEKLEKCDENVTPPTVGGSLCILDGYPNCMYNVTFIDGAGRAETFTTQLDGQGQRVIDGCLKIQTKACVICDNDSCPGGKAP